MTEVKTLFFDIETAPIQGATWGIWNTNVPHIFQDWNMLSFAWSWAGSDKREVIALPDFNKKGSDKKLCKHLHKLFNEADILVAHNGDKFDIRKAKTRFLIHDLPAPKPFQTVDTLKVARRHFAFTSNRLDSIAEALGVGRKMPNSGMQLWINCMANDPEAWEEMKAYNLQDVKVLEDVYHKFLMGGWIDNHPNMATISGEQDACPSCGKSGTMKLDGKRSRNTTVAYQFRCTNCKSYKTYRQSIPGANPTYK